VTTGILTATEGETHDPDHEEDDGSNPQQMYGKPGPEQNQDEQQRKKKHHERHNLSGNSDILRLSEAKRGLMKS
jgi:hypothetical protein